MSNTNMMDWENLPEPQQNEFNTMKLKEGKNVIRIVSNPAQIAVHWEKDISGTTHKVICSKTNACPICQKGKKAQNRFQMNVIDRADGQVKILECGKTIFDSIRNFAKDEDYGKPTKYDFTIVKSGSGLETKYDVIPKPKKEPLTEAEKELVKAATPIEEINNPATIEEINNLNLECLVESTGDLADDTSGSGDDWDDI